MNTRACFAAALWLAATASAELAHTDRNGRITALDAHGDAVAIQTNVVVPLKGWTKLPRLDHAQDVKRTKADGAARWRGRIEVAEGRFYRYEQTLREEGTTVRLRVVVRAEADVATEGVYLWLTLPNSAFAGGTCELLQGKRHVASAEMPRVKPERRHFLSGTASRLVATSADTETTLDATVEPACPATVQDNREWKSPTYTAFLRHPASPLAKGQTATFDLRLQFTAKADRSPATLTLDATRVRYRLDGFGGNYCFGIESPVTQFTLDNLRVAWARTEMTLPEWEPRNDNDSPTEANWAFLTSHDKPDTNLRREFLLAQQIHRRGIPYSITIWHLPEWLCEKPRTDKKRPNRRRVHPDKWPELLESIGSYLLYAKRQYGVEPTLFSFNEPNAGVRVRFTPEEHRDAIKRIGAHFERLGLRTKMLLADVTNARGTHTYALPTANDPEAMRYVGALSFHSWGGATPAQYAAWADLADRLTLPLVVGELGVDAGAWRGRTYRSFHYGLREVRMYQELVLHARPRATMQWEFTGDYGTVDVVRDAAGKAKLVPHARFWFVKHFCDLTPPKAEVLATASDHPKVLCTAFRGEADGQTVYALHIANLGAAREATLTGLPAELKRLRAIRTSAADSFKELPPVEVAGGELKVGLAAQSLLTLTMLPVASR